MGGSEGRCKAGDVEGDEGTDDLRPTSPPSGGARRRWWEATAAVVVVVLGVGVYWASKGGDGAEVVSTGDAASPEATADHDGAYLLTEGTVDGVSVPIVAGSEPTLVIDGDQWGGTAACNSFGGTATIDDAGAVGIEGFAWTAMGCEPALMESESAYLGALSRVEAILRDEDLLTLSGGGVMLSFERQARAEEEGGPFTDIDWQLDTIVEGDTARHSPPPWGSLLLGSDGSLYADGPCVVLTGSYGFDGIELRPTEMAADYAASCGGEPGPDDNAIISIIEGARPVVTDGGRRLTLSQGTDQLIYVRDDQAEEAAAPPTPLDMGLASVVAVTDDLTLVQLSGDGTTVERSVELADSIPGVLAVDSVSYDSSRDVAYVGVRRSGRDSLDCIGSVVQIDWTGAARTIADGRLPVIDADSTRLAHLQTSVVDGDCLFTEVVTHSLGESREVAIDDIEDVASGASPDAHLTWDGDLLVASSGGRSFSLEAGEAGAFATDVRMATRIGGGFIGQIGCCVPPMSLVTANSLAGPWQEVAALDAPIESLRAVEGAALLVDAEGTLLGYSRERGLVAMGTGFVAADGVPM